MPQSRRAAEPCGFEDKNCSKTRQIYPPVDATGGTPQSFIVDPEQVVTLPFPHLSGPKYWRWFAGVRIAQLGSCGADYALKLSIVRAKTNDVYP